MAFSFLATKRVNKERHAQLGLLVLAQGGGSKEGNAEINKQLAAWEKESN